MRIHRSRFSLVTTTHIFKVQVIGMELSCVLIFGLVAESCRIPVFFLSFLPGKAPILVTKDSKLSRGPYSVVIFERQLLSPFVESSLLPQLPIEA